MIPELERAPSVIVRDADASEAAPPPPSSRRRARIRTWPGLGEDAEAHVAVSDHDDADYRAVDELLEQSFAFDII